MLTERGKINIISIFKGRIAQLVRAPALQAGGHRFESCFAQIFLTIFIFSLSVNIYSKDLGISFTTKIPFGDWSYYLKNGNGLKVDYQILRMKSFSFLTTAEISSYKTYRETYRLNLINFGCGYKLFFIEKDNYRVSFQTDLGLSYIEKRDNDNVEKGFCEFLSPYLNFDYKFFETFFGFSVGYLREKIFDGKDNFIFNFNIIFADF